MVGTCDKTTHLMADMEKREEEEGLNPSKAGLQ
jgi:hypothetical protein